MESPGQADPPLLLGHPVALNCFCCPKALCEHLKIQDNNLEAGLSDEMKLDMPLETDNGVYSISRSIGELKLELEWCGLDIPFCIMTSSPTEEIYLFDTGGESRLRPMSSTGVTNWTTLDVLLLAMKIKGSLGSAVLSRVAMVTEADTPGPVLFKVAVCCISLCCQCLKAHQ
jgi:hypothetical protein